MIWTCRLILLLSLTAAVMVGCGSDDSPVTPADLDLTGDWFRVGEADCLGSFSLEHSPLNREREFIDAERLRVEQTDNTLHFHIEGGLLLDNGEGILGDDGIIAFGMFGLDITPQAGLEDGLYYTQIETYREAYLEDSMRLVFQDRYEAKLLFRDEHGADEHELSCTHVFEADHSGM